MKARFWIFISAFSFLYLILVFNLYRIQVKKGDFYTARAESQLAVNNLTAPRGNIYFTDKDNNFIPAALEKKYNEIYAVPTEIEDASEMARIIGPILGLEVEDLERKFNKTGDEYELLVEKATDEQLDSLNLIEKGLRKGIYPKTNLQRFYPLEKEASHLIGFITSEDEEGRREGVYGLEAYYEERLAGKNGEALGDKFIRPIAGNDLYLTIDKNIQDQAEDILSDLVGNYNAKGGSVIVQNPDSGEILAMVNMPGFNPNDYSNYEISSFLNPAVENIYEPGSIFKVITMAIGLDTKSITPETTYVDLGERTIDGRTIKNWDLKAHGTMTMTNVIEKSLNTGTVFAEEKIGHSKFLSYLKDFRLDETTDVDLPGEVRGSLASLENDPRDINFATASYGQGISVTPIRLITAISAIANGGLLMKPILEKGEQETLVKRVISREAARQVQEMMVSAVDGAIVAAIPGYNVAGKTGTAQIPDFNKGGYTDRVINTYGGFAPAFDPEFTILIKLDDPAGAPLAGQTVVPAFKELAQFIINYYGIAPDRVVDDG